MLFLLYPVLFRVNSEALYSIECIWWSEPVDDGCVYLKPLHIILNSTDVAFSSCEVMHMAHLKWMCIEWMRI